MRIGKLLCLTAFTLTAQPAHANDITGAWESNQGPITITKAGDGTYSVDFKLVKGKVVGSLEGDVFKGTWVRHAEPERCKTEKDGSPFWGGFKVTFYPEIPGAGFQGSWFACTHELKSGMMVENWTGARPK
jgi:hypothetical protein